MPAGLQNWDAGGGLQVDLTDRLTQFVGAAGITAGNSGIVSVNGIRSGNRVWGFFAPDAADASKFATSLPKFSFSTSGVSWAYDSGSGAQQVGGTLYYGIY